MNILQAHMGDQFARLPALVQKVHLGSNRLEGWVRVVRGNMVARTICQLFRFPPESDRCRLVVRCSHSEQEMLWHRNFDGLDMVSHFRRSGEYLVERLGPLAMYFRAIEDKGRLSYDFRHTTFLGVRLPGFLSPRIIAFESEGASGYQFSVRVTMPFVGEVISYSGDMSVYPG